MAVLSDEGALAFSIAGADSFSFSFNDLVRAKSTLAVPEGGLGGKGWF